MAMADITVDRTCCKGCGICLSVCPEKIFVKSKKRNDYGTNMPEAVKTEKCRGCGICERLCPDGAINVEGEEK